MKLFGLATLGLPEHEIIWFGITMAECVQRTNIRIFQNLEIQNIILFHKFNFENLFEKSIIQ